MRKCSLAFLCMSAVLLLYACGASSTAQPYTNMHTVTAMSAKVAAHYGETNPTITHVMATLTEGTPATAVPMNGVALTGHFHKGPLVATQLSFSMLADGSKVWSISATDDQYSTTHTEVWVDYELDIRL